MSKERRTREGGREGGCDVLRNVLCSRSVVRVLCPGVHAAFIVRGRVLCPCYVVMREGFSVHAVLSGERVLCLLCLGGKGSSVFCVRSVLIVRGY